MKKLLMYGKGYATVVGFVLVGLADGLIAAGFGSSELLGTIHQIGLALGGFGTARKVLAGI